MSANLSRRDFMKCAGVLALSVASAGLLSGCGGPSGVRVTLEGYEQGWFENLAGNLSGMLKDQVIINAVVKIQNGTDNSITLPSTPQNILDTVTDSLLNGQIPNVNETLSGATRVTDTEGKEVWHLNYAYQIGNTGSANYYSQALKPGATGYLKIYCIVPKDWQTLYIAYNPEFSSGHVYNFTLRASDRR